MWQKQPGRLPGGSGLKLGLEDGEGLDEGGTCRPPPQGPPRVCAPGGSSGRLPFRVLHT